MHSYSKLNRVTSDTRPWPAGGTFGICTHCGLAQTVVDQKWRRECAKIYASYHIYRQAGGAEQPVFCGQTSAPRSRILVDWIARNLDLPPKGRLLDIGCANGGFLREFHRRFPSWDLYGSEYDTRQLKHLRQIPRFRKLFTRKNPPPHKHFNLVTMIHVLEHIPGPSRFLAEAVRFGVPHAPIFIQVPDAATNPFILPVADHASHFTAGSLRAIIRKAGLRQIKKTKSLIPRELSCLVDASSKKCAGSAETKVSDIKKSIKGLLRYSQLAEKESLRKALDVFGSSISASWLYKVTRGRVRIFIDEDPAKIGREHLGIPIERPTKSTENLRNTLWLPSTDPKLKQKLQKWGYRSIRFLS